jgi:hypothetical protein
MGQLIKLFHQLGAQQMFECAKWQDAIRQRLDDEGVTPKNVFQIRDNNNELNVALSSTNLQYNAQHEKNSDFFFIVFT